MTIFLSVGCFFGPPRLPPTPTSVEGVSLPLETSHHGEICVDLGPEVQVLFASSEDEWNEIWSQLLADNPPLIDVASVADVVQETNFQTHALLLAVRDCHPTTGYKITIDRAVEGIRGQLQVYVALYDPVPGQAVGAAHYGYYHLARLPWSGENPTNLTIDVVTYKLWNDNRQ